MSDKSQTPTGVFVRLPLSKAVEREFHKERVALWPDEVRGLEDGLIAIGTPVAGGELEVRGYEYEVSRQGCAHFSHDVGPSVGTINSELSDIQYRNIVPLVRQSDHQAALAAAQAEIARLRRALQEIHDTGHDLPEFMRVEMMVAEAEKALKGPEA